MFRIQNFLQHNSSGGPLFAENGTAFYQFGLTSYGQTCKGVLSLASVYTDVYSFIDWIKKKIEEVQLKKICKIHSNRSLKICKKYVKK